GLECGSRTGEQSFLHPDALKLLLLTGPTLSALGEWDLEQGSIGTFLCRVRRLAKTRGDPFLEVVFDLIANVLLEPADYEAFMSEVLGSVIVWIAYGGGIQQRHQRREAPSRTVVRRG